VTRCSRLTPQKSHWEQVEIQRGTPHLRRACCISNDVAKKRADQSLQFQMFLELESNESIDNDFEGWYSDWTPVLCPRNWSALPWGLHAWEKSSGRRFRDAMTQLWTLKINLQLIDVTLTSVHIRALSLKSMYMEALIIHALTLHCYKASLSITLQAHMHR